MGRIFEEGGEFNAGGIKGAGKFLQAFQFSRSKLYICLVTWDIEYER